MQQDALIGLGQAEGVTDIGSRPALDITQSDHLPLRKRQRLDRSRDDGLGLGSQQLLLGRDAARRRRPAVDQRRILEPEEPIGVNGRLVGDRRQPGIADRRVAPLARSAGPGTVFQDADDPGFKLERNSNRLRPRSNQVSCVTSSAVAWSGT